MDCRRALFLSVLLCSSVAGCTPGQVFPLWSSDSDKPKYVQEPIAKEQVKELKPNTLVALGGLREQTAADIAKTPEAREMFLEDAARCYERALKSDPKCVDAKLALARLQERTGKHKDALKSYEEAIKMTPADPNIWYEVGMIHARNKEWEPALKHLEKANTLEPQNHQLLSSYALCLARAGRFDESLACMKKFKTEAEAHCDLARMLHHMQQDDLCRTHLQLALKADPSLQTALDFQAELNAPATASNNVQVPPTAN